MRSYEIEAARKSFGLSRIEMARMLGIHPGSLSDIENGRYEPKESVTRLLQAYCDGYRPKDWPLGAIIAEAVAN